MSSPATAPGNRGSPDELAVWSDFLLASNHVQQQLERTLRAETGLSLAQYTALHALEETDGSATVNQVGDALLYSTGSVTNLLKAMERQELITRARSTSDRRVVHIEATPHGLDAFAQATDVVLDIARREFTDLLTDEELPAVAGFITRLCERDPRSHHSPYAVPPHLVRRRPE